MTINVAQSNLKNKKLVLVYKFQLIIFMNINYVVLLTDGNTMNNTKVFIEIRNSFCARMAKEQCKTMNRHIV